jgi:hypothetical protein
MGLDDQRAEVSKPWLDSSLEGKRRTGFIDSGETGASAAGFDDHAID